MATVLLFITVLLLPTLDKLVDLDHSIADERAAPFPTISLDRSDLARLPGQFKAYFKENFGFRSGLITMHGLLKHRLLRMSPSPRVVLGSNDWLYFRDEGVMDDFRKLYPFKEDELGQWVTALQARSRFCEERGIPYLFTVSPSKPTICPDHLPKLYAPRGGVSRLDQLVDALRTTSPGFSMVDVRDALIGHPERTNLYFRTDTHWNRLGAFTAYQEIASALKVSFPMLQIQGREPLATGPESGLGGDLARIIGLQKYLQEDSPGPVDWTTRRVLQEDGAEPEWQSRDILHVDDHVFVCPEGEIERGVIFHDSYGMALLHPLAAHFKRAVFVWSNEFLPDVVEKEMPDVVIQQIVERRLMTWMPDLSELQPLGDRDVEATKERP